MTMQLSTLQEIPERAQGLVQWDPMSGSVADYESALRGPDESGVATSAPALSAGTISRQEKRSLRLSQGLIRLGLRPGATVGILVCRHHREDLWVAAEAVARSAAVPLHLAVNGPIEDLAVQLEPIRGGLLLMCSEGVSAWRATGIPMRAIGDGPDMMWWRALEMRNEE